ncbi:MAG: EAL domain-containing protein [Leptolyngbyaceae cyanobacterium]|mgnify:CR=1 FL=1
MSIIESKATKISSFKSPSILIVENEGLIALDIENYLLDLDYQVTGIAETGQMVIQKALELRPDLILMDIRLKEEMDGIEAASEITAQIDIPIIFLTAFADQDTLKRAKSISPFAYILKPFDSIDLRTSIEIALQKHCSEKIIKQQKTWLNTVLESIGDAVVTTDNDGTITFINRVAESLTQWSKSDALGKQINEVIPLIDGDKNPIENPILQALRKGQGDRLPEGTLLITKNQQEVPVDDSAVLILDENNEAHGAVIVFRDVTESLVAKNQLFHSAYYDALTNLPNRSLFIDRLQHLVELNKRYSNCKFAVLFIDLDRFKNVNDSLGHPMGDRLLVITAQRLQKCLRPTDTVSRFGGDEFAILLEQVEDLDTACQLAERINRELSAPCCLDNYDLFSSASIGIVQGQPQYVMAEDMIRDADIAMYQAKTNGKGCYAIFDETMYTQVKGQLTLENDLRRAITDHALTLHYQPIVSLVTQEIVGVEALVRWEHPERGLIPPNRFIPIAEETDLIVQLDRWVLGQACQQVSMWQDQFPNQAKLEVSVNVSSYHFSRSNVVEHVKQTLADTELPASSLRLEITESALIENPESAAQILSALKRLGLQIAIDDFGTGYSSLSYLHKYPIDTLKIDRSFIQNINSSLDQFEITRTIIILAKTLNIAAIAEGVETEKQLDAIHALGCEYAQGYYLHRPLTDKQVTTLLTN